MAELVCENLGKTFGGKVIAVDDVSLKVANQQFLTLLGPSGCGKTTILRLIAGLETPDSGRVFIDGKPVNDLSPQERDIAMVFQSYALYPHMNVFSNLAVSLRIKKVGKREIERRVTTTAKLLGIDSLLSRMPKELSGGQRQRVALGRAIVREPKLFLLDEPLSNLDAILREKTRAELRGLFSRIGGTVVYVTHDQIEAMTMSDKVAVIEKGKIQQTGSPSEIYDSPQNMFVANFVGSPRMNFITGEVSPKGGEGIFVGGEIRLKLPDAILQKVRDSARDRSTSPESRRYGIRSDRTGRRGLVVGIRPEDIDIEPSGPAAYPATVYLTEPLGSQTLVFVETEGVKLRILSKRNYRPGDKIWTSFDSQSLHFFDAETGIRL